MKSFYRNCIVILLSALGILSFQMNGSAQCTSTVTTFPYDQGFEGGTGDWTQSTVDDFDWTNNSGQTPTGSGGFGTGPDSAFQGDFYMYTEATGQPSGDSAVLESPCFVLPAGTPGDAYIDFYYHMFAQTAGNMGTLALEIDQGVNGTWVSLFSLTGGQGTNWNFQSINLAAYEGSTVKFRFVGIIGPGFQSWQGDMSIDSIVVHDGSLFTSLTTNDVNCNGGSDGSIITNTIGGTGAYTYLWSNGATTSSITSLTSGTYTVTVTDQGGNTVTATGTVNQPSVPTPGTITASQSQFCQGSGGSANLSISTPPANATYTFTTAQQTSNTAGGALTFDFTNTPATATGDATLTVFFQGDVDTPGEEIEYIGESGAIIDSSGNTTQCAGTFASKVIIIPKDSIIAWADNGTITIIADAQPAVGTVCGGVSHSGFMTIEYDYSTFQNYWFAGSCGNTVGAAIDSSLSTTVSPTTTTTYYARYYDSFCNTWSTCDSTTITINPLPTVTVNPSAPDICLGFSTSLTASGATSYTWSPSTGLSGTTGSTVTANPTTTTVYEVIGTDGNACSDTTQVTVTVNPAVIATISSTTAVSCSGGSDGSATVSASAGTPAYTYLWSSGSTSATATGLSAGSHTVTVTDANGCTATATATVSGPSSPVVVNISSTTDVTCFGLTNGTAFAQGSGGTFPYTYNWSNASTSQLATNLAAGTYTITLTDANGCTSTDVATISAPSAPVTASASPSVYNGGFNISCNGGNDGNITLTVAGGTPPYTYSWSNGATTQNLTNVTAGTYFANIVDANGCSTFAFQILTEPPLSVSATITSTSDVSCFGGNDGAATVSASGGVAPYTYAWPNGSTSTSTSTLTAGNQIVSVTDANGCTTTATAVINQPAAIAPNLSTTGVSCNGR